MQGRKLVRGLSALIAALTLAGAVAGTAWAGTTTLTVARSGLQLATVSDSEGQISCGADCTGTYAEECVLENQHGACTVWAPPRVALTTTPPAGFGVVWDRACDESSRTGTVCTLAAAGSVKAHFDDLTPPSVALTVPAAGPVRGTISLAATASDPQTGISHVSFSVGGVTVGADTVAPYSASYTTSSRTDGAVTVIARAVNNDGDVAETSARTITIDNTAPSLAIDSGPDGQTYGPGTTQTWTFGSTDWTTGIAARECSVVATSAPAAYGACSSSGAHSVADRPEGDYTLSVRVRDNAGNETVATRSFAIDATAPATAITSGPADGSSTSATAVTFAFAAGEPSTFACRVYPAALTPPAFAACSDAAGHTAAGFSPGTYTFEVVATDAAGNTDATPERRTFTVTAPVADEGGGGTPSGGGGTTSGAPALLDVGLSQRWARSGRLLRVRKLTVTRLPAGATVRLRCTGKRCPVRRRSFTAQGPTLALRKPFGARKLAKGTTIEIRVTLDGYVGRVFRLSLRKPGKPPRPTVRCLAPGASSPGTCG